MVKAPESRSDKATLRSPRKLDDGTAVYDAILATADVPLVYSWGEEVPTREALSDPEYLQALRGLSLLVQHAPNGLIKDGATPKEGHGRRAGTVIDAKFDDESGQVIVELAVPNPDDQEMIRSRLRDISEGYTPVILKDDSGVSRQVKRVPNHVALTEEGRAKDATIRVDSGGSLEEIMKMLIEMKEMMTAQKDKMDSMLLGKDEENVGEKLDSSVEEAMVEELGDACRGDSASFKSALFARIAREAVEMSELKSRADSLGLKVEPAQSANALRKSIALALGGDAKRCDSADYCDGIIASAKPSIVSGGERVDSKSEQFPV